MSLCVCGCQGELRGRRPRGQHSALRCAAVTRPPPILLCCSSTSRMCCCRPPLLLLLLPPSCSSQDMRKALEACIGRMLEIRHWMVRGAAGLGGCGRLGGCGGLRRTCICTGALGRVLGLAGRLAWQGALQGAWRGWCG